VDDPGRDIPDGPRDRGLGVVRRQDDDHLLPEEHVLSTSLRLPVVHEDLTSLRLRLRVDQLSMRIRNARRDPGPQIGSQGTGPARKNDEIWALLRKISKRRGGVAVGKIKLRSTGVVSEHRT